MCPPGRIASMPARSAAAVVSMSRRASALTVPTGTVMAASP